MIDSKYQYTLDAMLRGSNYTEKITNSCRIPDRHVSIDLNSNCFLCQCEAWLPVSVGKVQDFLTLDDVFSSSIAQKLRTDIFEKKYTWCAVTHCGIVEASKYPTKYVISINIDESCNLACPSCRNDLITHSSGPEFDRKVNDVNRIVNWLEQFDQPLVVVLTGNGDPFASQIIRKLIHNHIPKANQTFKIKTNGLLIKKQIPNSSIINNIEEFSISIDAGTKAVYEDVRRPGKWEVLIENLDWLADKNYVVHLNFVLQKKNFRDLINFIILCDSYGYFGNITGLEDWATFNYYENNVLDKNHLDHQECIEILRQAVASKNKRIFLSPPIRNLI
jgi:sulfatase maturation enzyme AslB (radical SAM superfamily)